MAHEANVKNMAQMLALAAWILAVTAVTGCAQAQAARTPQKGEKPNIVLINMDNFGYGELGCYGGGIIRGGARRTIENDVLTGIEVQRFKREKNNVEHRTSNSPEASKHLSASGGSNDEWDKMKTQTYDLEERLLEEKLNIEHRTLNEKK